MGNYILSAALELKDKFSSQIDSASTSFKNFSSQVKTESASMGSSLKDLGNQLGINSKGAISSFRTVERYGKIATAATVAFTGKSYLGWVDLEDQLLRNAAITGASAKEQALMNSQVKQLGNTTRFTQKQVAEAQMYQAMAGYKTNEILSVTPTLLKLSIATGEDLAKTSDIVTDSLSAFGLSVKDVGMYTDILASTANNTNTTVGMMGNAFVYVGASSRAMGESFEEVAVSLGILADNGIKGEKAGTGLNALYARLAKPTTIMKKALKYANVELKDQSGNFKGLRKIIEESRPALEKMTEVQRNNWLATIAGTEGVKIWSSIMNNSAEGTKKAEDAVYNATGALDKFYNTMTKGSKQTLEEFKSAVDGFSKAFAEGAAPIIDEKLKEITSAINGVTENQLSTENIDKYIDHIILRAKQAAGVYVGLKATVAAAGTGATILGLGAGSITALALGGSALVGWGANKLRDVYMNSSSYNGDYMERIRLSREADTILKESKNRSFLNTGNSFGSLGAFNSEKYTKNKLSVGNFGDKEYLKTNGATPFNETKPEIKVDLSHLTLNTMKNTEELIKEVQERIGEEMRNAIANAQMTQQ